MNGLIREAIRRYDEANVSPIPLEDLVAEVYGKADPHGDAPRLVKIFALETIRNLACAIFRGQPIENEQQYFALEATWPSGLTIEERRQIIAWLLMAEPPERGGLLM